MNIVGISAFVHDAAACLVRDGRLVANAEEERFNRQKHTAAFPIEALQYVLKEGGITLREVDVIAFNWHPWKSLVSELVKLLLPTVYLKVARHNRPPKNFRSIGASFFLRRALQKHFPGQFTGRIVWVEHHLAHAASAYYTAPFPAGDADVVVVDGHGDNASASVYSVSENRFRLRWKIPLFDSIGIIYTNFTHFLGFGEYQEGKTMALASFGRDRYREQFGKIISLHPDGRYRIRRKRYLGLWNYRENRLDREFGPMRGTDGPLEQRHFDIACSMQSRVKEAVLHLIGGLREVSGNTRLGLAGGLFLNCDINRAILQECGYDHIHVPPFPSDSGGAAGAALYAAFVSCGETPEEGLRPFSPYLGPEYAEGELLAALEDVRVAYRRVDDPCREAAAELKESRVIGWFQGRMECGPRALGNRSILASPFDPGMQDYLNGRVKNREPFRPFAPVATEEAATRYFDLIGTVPGPASYMLVTATVKEEFRRALPAVTHVDGTARIQVVTADSNPLLYRLLKEFETLTGYAVLVNTSFNRDEPIVCSPRDAIGCFTAAGLDSLFLGPFICSKGVVTDS